MLAMLDRTTEVRLTVVTAPGGYGKSTLVRDWATARLGESTAWVELDERDNDGMRLWSRILDAITETGVQLPGTVLRSLGAGRLAELEHGIEEIRDALTNVHLTIVFDDFHLISSPGALDSFEFFLDTAPANIGIVLIGRQEPKVSVARLRVTSQLVDIRERDLRFTDDEIAELTRASGLEVDADTISHVGVMTTGWAAAIRLALVSAFNAPDANAALLQIDVHDRALSDFFVEEVLDEMPATTREFLLVTSILDQVNAAVASAVSAVEHPHQLLDDLARRSILTTQISGPGKWFKYHHLFKQLLSIQLSASRSIAEVRRLHSLVADWYAEHGDLEHAVSHSLSAGDSQSATDYLAELAPLLMLTGRSATLLELSQRVIDSVEEPTIVQLVCKGEALHSLGDQPVELDRIIEHVARELTKITQFADTGTPTGVADPTSWESPTALPWIRSVQLRRRGDAVDLAAMNLPEFIPSPSSAVEGEVAEGLIWLEQYSEAERLLRMAMTRRSDDGYVPHIVNNLGLLAASRAGQGHTDEAQSMTDAALALCAENGLGNVRHTMYARLMSAWLAWSRCDLEQAESKTIELQEFAENAADVPIAIQHAQLRSAIRWSLGDHSGARSLLDKARIRRTGIPVSGHFRDRLLLSKARLDLLDGDAGAAQLHLPDWRDRLQRGPNTMREWLVLTRVRLAVDGPADLVNEPLAPASTASSTNALEWQRILAHALDLFGHRERAIDTLASSLARAKRLGLVQPILDERHVLGSLLPLAAQSAGIEIPHLGTIDDVSAPRPVYVEPLTGREQEILEHMTTHLTYPEIAAVLYISLATVKTHASAVFRKLAVSKRSDAVTRARAYGLLT